MPKLTFDSLKRFLEQLGFQTKTISNSHVLFEHPTADASIALRLYEGDEIVAPAALGYVRHTLDEWGILERGRFEAELRQHSLVG